ncbi:MAG: pilus (MSHA type) biogenesis protein MshL, partial [Natronospirillum sp.]
QASQINTANSTDFWGTLESTLSAMMETGGDRQLVVNRQTGLIIVRGTPRELQSISEFLYEAEIALQQQVIIEARVLEVRLSETYESGIDWQVLGRASGIDGFNVASAVSGNNFSAPTDNSLGGAFNLSLKVGDFSSVIRALRTQGEVEVLSSPRISTVSNQKAVIKVGSEEQFVTVSSVSSVTEDGTATAAPTFSLEPYFSGISLDVTPQIADQNQIILHVHPSVIQVSATTKAFTIQGEEYNLPLANSTIRETDSVVRAQNGQVVVIGGLLQNSTTNLRSGVPERGHGLLGWLFGQERRTNDRTELIILLRPVVVDENTFGDDIENTATRLRRQ